ncbi:MAG: TetR family transcriptional regulator [Acidobacteria bacterium]|nr:TetR family transcriptional regulator [Acidobacteriota bacterium]
MSKTKRLVKIAPDDSGSKARIFRAASAEFAARGFAGGHVDRIAAAAGVNKAMIYYHFKSKAALYREILREMFEAVAARLDEMSARQRTPDGKIRAFVEAIAHEAEARPHFPPIWFREIAEGGAHLDPATIATVAGIVRRLAVIVRDGVAAGRFKPVDPLLVHGGIVAPVLLYYATAGLRKRIAKAGVTGADRFASRDVIAHVQRVALTTLHGRM